MSEYLVQPPIAFLLYLGLVGVLLQLGRWMAAHGDEDIQDKTATYTGGEELIPQQAALDYRSFTPLALFFVVLHLGVLILATGSPSRMTALYLGVLTLILLILIVGSRPTSSTTSTSSPSKKGAIKEGQS